VTPRATALRIVVWLAVLGWAVWIMRQPVATRVLSRPEVVPAPSASSDLAGALALVVAAACPVPPGTRLTVQVGAAGLIQASVDPPVPDATCLTRAVWGTAWPSLQRPTTMEWPLG
jgi:hypothetical protein